MDGYAVRAADTAGAELRLAGEIAAGEAGDQPLEPGTALGITTGAPIPPGADAVLQSELAELNGGTVRATELIEAGTHIRVRGEDVHAGDLIAPAGELLTLARDLVARRGRRRRGLRAPPRPPAPARDRLGAAAARRAAGAGQDPRVERADGAPAGRARGRAGDRRRRDRRRLRVDPRRGRGRAGRRRAGRLRRRLGRAARPRQAGVRGVRDRRGVLARAREARQALVVRPLVGETARVRPARQSRSRASSASSPSSSRRCAACTASATPRCAPSAHA